MQRRQSHLNDAKSLAKAQAFKAELLEEVAA